MNLRSRIAEIIEEHPIGWNPTRKYFPDNYFENPDIQDDTLDSHDDSPFTKEAIGGALGVAQGSQELVDFVCQQATRTFATLVLTFQTYDHRQQAMKTFWKLKFTDDELPSRKLRLCTGNPCQHADQDCRHHFPSPFPWDLPSFDSFKTERWKFLVPEFQTDKFIYEFDEGRVLPFTEKIIELDDGFFSKVKCVKMLAGRKDRVKARTEETLVALKKLKQLPELKDKYDIATEWLREAGAHEQLNGKNKHVIRGIAAYKMVADDPQNDKYFLVLEWADGGSLRGFLKDNPEAQVSHEHLEQSRDRVMAVLEQLYGLAEALETMHHTTAHSVALSKHNSARSSPHLAPVQTFDKAAVNLGQSSENPNQTLLPDINIQHSGDNGVNDQMPLPRFNIQHTDDDDRKAVAIPNEYVIRPGPENIQAIEGLKPIRRNTADAFSPNWRHGDIKPENILRFKEGKKDAWLGLLKLADLGRAKRHEQATMLRQTKEIEHFRTAYYEPPDLQKGSPYEDKVSRLFDIWSMGCVIFETVLWLLYGMESGYVAFFNANNLTTGAHDATPYWEKTKGGTFRVSDAARVWMNHILEDDPERMSAIGDLVRLVKDKLIIIELPQYAEEYLPGYRTNATDLKKVLGEFIAKAETDRTYLFTGTPRVGIPAPNMDQASMGQTPQSRHGSFLSPDHAKRSYATAIAKARVYTINLTSSWEVAPEDNFMSSMLAESQIESTSPKLCQSCLKTDILSPRVSFDVDSINMPIESCELCNLVYDAVENQDDQDNLRRGNVTLTRSGDHLVFGETGPKVLRLCRTSRPEHPSLKDIKMGLPNLPVLESRDPSLDSLKLFIKVPKEWLHECDKHHDKTCAPQQGPRVLPKRLISVENPAIPKIVETKGSELDPQKTEYIAFSHKWGNMPEKAKTTRKNITRRTRVINLNDLSDALSFLNAIKITSALGQKYLWIDSLCILQGDDGDFNTEADKMQSVFSGAYCVLAACSAEGAKDGFLQHRDPTFIKMKSNDGDIFVSPVTNDFERDVLRSPLSGRGWVLQERALARRTIFVTKTQMYMECGDGIRCETLAKLKNDEVAMLGSANFPGYTVEGDRTVGEQIYLFIKLFEQYSNLHLSWPTDRPVAIDGLMERLATAFRTRCMAGLFERDWGRCLLWQQADKINPVNKISAVTEPDRHVREAPPSWSWMAIEGPISFLRVEGSQVDWNKAGIDLPFTSNTPTSWLATSRRGCNTAIYAHQAFDFDDSSEAKAFLSYDNCNDPSPSADTKCVIIGSTKQPPNDRIQKKHYVLLVRRSSPDSGATVYKRVGIGYLLGKFIYFNNSTIAISIK